MSDSNRVLSPPNSGSHARWEPPELLLELADSDSELIAELVGIFKSDTTVRLQHVREALAVADGANLRVEAHTIKGGARQVGAESLAALCQEIESAAAQASIPYLSERVDRLQEQFDHVCRAMDVYLDAPGR